MTTWMSIWTMVLIAVIAVYSLVVVSVGIGGARDLATMFRRLRDPEDKDKD